ncbi:MAG TPA: hypothetical protein VFA23_16925 [Dongiaceae bacterium]|nr:hypothetical protein [Dongiaceae bacterium]
MRIGSIASVASVTLFQFYVSIVDPAILAQPIPPSGSASPSRTSAPGPAKPAKPSATGQLPSFGGFTQLPGNGAEPPPGNTGLPAH